MSKITRQDFDESVKRIQMSDIVRLLADKKAMKNSYIIVSEQGLVGHMSFTKDKSMLEQLQSWVGGYIELVPSDYIKNHLIIVNEDGINMRLPYNKTMNTLFGLEIYGTACIVRKEDFK
jgi:hypothetical protein